MVTFKRTEDLSLVTTAMSNEPAWKGASAIAAAGRSRRLLSSSEWVMVQNVINDASFWSLQPYQAEACSGGCDAWPWILEGRRGSTYHVATRLYLPSSLLAGSENERFLTASRALLRIAGVDSIRGKRAYARP
ncbi:MAG: hypothetical protein JNM38_22335 [Acidobacteria bacterium]|nr:hypothetical protein [Acidobacteriota bacterium]